MNLISNVLKTANNIISFSDKEKQRIVDLIRYEDELYNKILDDIMQEQFVLTQWDYAKLGWNYTKDDLKAYFDSNYRLKRFIQNQIYPTYKRQIDELIEQDNKRKYEQQKSFDINSLNTLQDINKIVSIIEKYNITDQDILINVYQKIKHSDKDYLIKKIVDRINNVQIKKQFERLQFYHPNLFARKKFISISKQIFSTLNKNYLNIVKKRN